MANKTKSKNTFLLFLITILLVFAANSIVFAGAAEPNPGGGDKKYSGPAVIVDMNIVPEEGTGLYLVTGTLKCKNKTSFFNEEAVEIDFESFEEAVADDLIGLVAFNEGGEICDVDASPAVVRVVTSFTNNGEVITAKGIMLFEKGL